MMMENAMEKAKNDCTMRNPFESLPDSLVLEILSRLPSVEDQAMIVQCCRHFRELVRQIPVLHICEEDELESSLEGRISRTIQSKGPNRLTELKVQVDEELFDNAAVQNWISRSSHSLRVLHLKDDWNDSFRRADLSFRLRSALTCPLLEELVLSGSCRVPLNPSLLELDAPGFRHLKELTLLRLNVPTSEALQTIVTAAPCLSKLFLLSFSGVQELSIQSQSLEHVSISRVHTWTPGYRQAPLEKFHHVILSTPNLRWAAVADVSGLIDIRSSKLEYLGLSHAASCTVQCFDLSKLVDLAVDAFGGPPHGEYENYDEFRGEWPGAKILNLVSHQKGTLKSLNIQNPGSAAIGKELLIELFEKVGSLQQLHVAEEFLVKLEIEKLMGEESDPKWQHLVRSGALLGELEIVTLHFCRNKASEKHVVYLDFFLQTCPKLSYMSIEHHSRWPIWEGAFIRAVLALQRRHPAVEIDLQLPDTDLGIPF